MSDPYGMSERQKILRAISDGLGAQDIEVVHGIPEETTRRWISTWRSTGVLAGIMKAQRVALQERWGTS